ncbi:MAG: hypothetical protein K2X47_11045 [Bdellovibrionales bacterium]|nr:hypothetical protein [Bdellovibrionales bacterium]
MIYFVISRALDFVFHFSYDLFSDTFEIRKFLVDLFVSTILFAVAGILATRFLAKLEGKPTRKW